MASEFGNDVFPGIHVGLLTVKGSPSGVVLIEFGRESGGFVIDIFNRPFIDRGTREDRIIFRECLREEIGLGKKEEPRIE